MGLLNPAGYHAAWHERSVGSANLVSLLLAIVYTISTRERSRGKVIHNIVMLSGTRAEAKPPCLDNAALSDMPLGRGLLPRRSDRNTQFQKTGLKHQKLAKR